MEFVRNNIYWIIGVIVAIGLVVVVVIYYRGAPDGKTRFIITPSNETNISPYDFSGDGDWIGDYAEEFEKIAPPASSGSSSGDLPVPLPSTQTPWEQGPSDQTSASAKPPPLPIPGGTPWGQGPSD